MEQEINFKLMIYHLLCKLKLLCIYCYNQLCHEKVTKAMPIDIIDVICHKETETEELKQKNLFNWLFRLHFA